jgi:hypothetical protein
MPTIFLSYRREDSKWIAGRIFDRLESHYGKGDVFMDIDVIPVGVDFREHIRVILKCCDILLAIVGPRWPGVDEAGPPRIADENDWVRIEIEACLEKNIPVIPVLVDRAHMPSPSDLPESMRPFAFRQAAHVESGVEFRSQMDRLIRSIDEHLKRPTQVVAPPSSKRKATTEPSNVTAKPRTSQRSDAKANTAYGKERRLMMKEQNKRLALKLEKLKIEKGIYGAPPLQKLEPSSKTKVARTSFAFGERVIIAAHERHPIETDAREQSCTITENGDLWVDHRIIGQRVLSGHGAYKKRPLIVAVPAHGCFVRRTLKLDEDAQRAGLKIVDDASSGQPKYWIVFPDEGLRPGGDPVNYDIKYACANVMTMTHWEARERLRSMPRAGTGARDDWDEEWVGVRITHPHRRVALSVTFPESLAGVQPYLRCLRHPSDAKYEIDEFGDARFPPANELIPDPEYEAEQRRPLPYTASTRTWRADVEPIVGHYYQLRWKLPEDPADTRVEGRTRAFRRQLLNLAERLVAAPEADKAAIDAFLELCTVIRIHFHRGGTDENWVTALWVYDEDQLALRPALSQRSWLSTSMTKDFKIPLGTGVAGAAFLQRRIISWGDWAKESFIEPVTHPHGDSEPAMELKNVLAVPIYDPEVMDLARPPPWATIGVVSFGTTASDSPINSLEADHPTRLRAVVQTGVLRILDVLSTGI